MINAITSVNFGLGPSFIAKTIPIIKEIISKTIKNIPIFINSKNTDFIVAPF